MTPDKDKGLYAKYSVYRNDRKDAPGEKHDSCMYFVLDLTHDPYAIAAIAAYGMECAEEYPKLARDLALAAVEALASQMKAAFAT